jgi:hypothetical protein
MEREIFFFPFLPSLQINKTHFYPPKMGAKIEEKKILSPLTVSLTDKRGQSVIK